MSWIHTWRQTELLQNFGVSFCQLCGSTPTTYSSRHYLSTPSRARCGLYTSDQLHSHSRVDKALARSVSPHKLTRSSGIEYTKRKVEVTGPAQAIAELEQGSYTVSSLSNCVETDAKICGDYCSLFCMEFNYCAYVKLKLYPVT